MKRLFLAAALTLLALVAQAQQALGPGTGLVSPEINPDHSVTFRYQNPKAKVVQITGDFLPTRPIEVDFDGRKIVYDAPGVENLKEGPGGVWSFTSAPLEGELYSYSFLVDGKKVMDPSNVHQNRDVATWTNIFSAIPCSICCTAAVETRTPGWTWAAPPRSWTTSLPRVRPNP